VVFVPGLGLGREAVLPTARHGSAAWSAEVVLLPGYGQRVPAGTDVSPPALADRLLAVLRDRGLGRVVLVGHSASCQVVAEAAAADPDRVAGLLLVGPTTDPRAGSWPGLVARWVRTAVWERPWQVPLLVRLYARTGLVGMAVAMDAARRHDVRRPLARVGVPTVVVRGRHDWISPPRWADRTAGLAGGRAVTLPAGAHMVVLTHPASVAPLVTEVVGSAATPGTGPAAGPAAGRGQGA